MRIEEFEAKMKGVVLNGELDSDDGLGRVEGLLIHELEKVNCSLETFRLRNKEIAPCQGCFGCWVRKPGECLMEDDSRAIVTAVLGANLIVLLTPVTFGGYSSELKKALDRSICLISPFFMTVGGETHHKPRYDWSPRFLGVGVTEDRDSECVQIFTNLVERNAINFHASAYSASVIDEKSSLEEICSDLSRAISELEIS
jgi:multimeric flavodoxin WrbA